MNKKIEISFDDNGSILLSNGMYIEKNHDIYEIEEKIFNLLNELEDKYSKDIVNQLDICYDKYIHAWKFYLDKVITYLITNFNDISCKKIDHTEPTTMHWDYFIKQLSKECNVFNIKFNLLDTDFPGNNKNSIKIDYDKGLKQYIYLDGVKYSIKNVSRETSEK